MADKTSGGKRQRKKKPTSKKYTKYQIEGESLRRKLKFCPRCGPGIFLADFGNRIYCGKCHYTEFIKK